MSPSDHEDENDPDGPFAFRRRKACNYYAVSALDFRCCFFLVATFGRGFMYRLVWMVSCSASCSIWCLRPEGFSCLECMKMVITVFQKYNVVVSF